MQLHVAKSPAFPPETRWPHCRARSSNEPWHIDVSIVKLLDGTKAYLHGVIDDFSRRILAWTLADRLDPMHACRVLAQAASNLQGPDAKVYVDSGVENLNRDVDALFSVSGRSSIISTI